MWIILKLKRWLDGRAVVTIGAELLRKYGWMQQESLSKRFKNDKIYKSLVFYEIRF